MVKNSSSPSHEPIDDAELLAELAEAGITPEAYTNRWVVLGVLCLSLVLAVMGNSALNVALPTIGKELEATLSPLQQLWQDWFPSLASEPTSNQSQLQWLVNAYQIAFGSLLMPLGAFGDRYGRKKALNIGLIIYGITACFAIIAEFYWQIMLIRTIMGLASAFIMPATMSLLTAAFLPRQRGTAISIWVAFAGIGGVIGSIASGLILQVAPWHWIFLINVPLVLLLLVMAHKYVPTSKDPNSRPIDWIGSFLAFVMALSFLYAFTEGPSSGWFSTKIIIINVVGMAFTVFFFVWMKKAKNPLFDLNWFKDRRFAMGAVTIFLQFMAAFAWFFISMQLFQVTLRMSPAEAGFLTIPSAIAQLVAAPFAQKLSDKLGPKLAAINGLLITTAAFIILIFNTHEGAHLAPLFASQVLFGCGLPWTGAPITNRMIQALPANRVGMGSAVNDVVRQMGAAVGVATLGSILSTVYTSGLDKASFPQEAWIEVSSGPSAAIVAIEKAGNIPHADQLITQVYESFAHGAQMALVGCAIVTFAACVLVGIFGLGDPNAPRAKDTLEA